jgi:tetratricopeptide (TPR) repeat protein
MPAGALIAIAAALAGAPVTFSEDIAPIIHARCATCHRPGDAAPFSLITYADVRSRAGLIAQVTRARQMPPWKPEPGFGTFAHSRRLTDTELALIEQWVQDGAPEGSSDRASSLLAAPAEWQLGKPDLVLRMSDAYELAPDGTDVFRTIVLPAGIARSRFVRAVEFRPGSRAVHHANIKIDATGASRRHDEEEPGPGFDGGSGSSARFPDGHFLGWTPGQGPQGEEATAWALPAASDLVIELHLAPTGKREAIQVSVGLYFSDIVPRRVPYMLRLGSQRIDIPAGASDYVSGDSYVLPVDVDVLRVQPHAHQLARTIEGTARLPDGTLLPLIRIGDWDFRWQDVYEYQLPLHLPAGTQLSMRWVYDNSPRNPRNPHHPPDRVTFGQTSGSEMGDLWLQVITRTDEERRVLDRDYAPKMLREDIAGVLKQIERTPADARLHADLGLLYADAGEMDRPLTHLAEAVRLDPHSAAIRYDFGTLLMNAGRLDAAREQFETVVRDQPLSFEGHNNLGVTFYKQQRFGEAAAAFGLAAALRPENAEVHHNLAAALAGSNQTDAAIAEYRRALALQPDAATHAGLASVLTRTGALGESIAHYRQALQLDRELTGAAVDLAWILATTDRADLRQPLEAIQLAEHAATATGYSEPTVLDTLAAAYFAAGQRERAVRTARTALDLAMGGGQTELADRIRARLSYYEQPQ